MNLQKAKDIIETGKELLEIDNIINSIQYIDKGKSLTNILKEARNDIIIEMFNLYNKSYNINAKSKVIKSKVNNNAKSKVIESKVNDTK